MATMEGSQSPNEQNNNGDPDQEQKMNVFLKVSKTVCVSVKKSDTVGNVKAILNEKEGISESVQGLYFSGERLSDYQKLVDCGIQKKSTMQVFVQDFVPLILFVKPLSHPKIIVIEVRSSDTIENVKSCIMAKEGTLSSRFSLIFAGRQLAEDMTLESLDIRGGSTLHMVTTQKDAMAVSVKLPHGEILKMELKLLYSVRDVKAVVESISGYPVTDLTLTYNGVSLEDSKKLSSYNVTEESMLEMVRQTIEICVEFQDGNSWRIKVHPDKSVIHVMEKLAALLGSHPDSLDLIFEGARIRGGKTLASYNIKNNSTLHLMFIQRGG